MPYQYTAVQMFLALDEFTTRYQEYLMMPRVQGVDMSRHDSDIASFSQSFKNVAQKSSQQILK